MNAKKEILELCGDETIEAICIGTIGYGVHSPKNPQFYSRENVNEALKLLDFEFDSSFGSENGYRLLAWTKTKVIIKVIYDGSETYEVVPRNPEVIMPEPYGG